jgi:hypothetical protein
MAKPEYKRFTVDAPGSIEGGMTLGVGRTECGDVTDGVSLNMGSPRNAGWVISFADLERWYLENKAFREALAKEKS